MSLPADASESPEAGEQAVGIPQARILVAEDSRVAYTVVDDILTAEGLVTCWSRSVEEISGQMDSFAPDLLLLSHWLPEGDTLGFLRSLSSRPQQSTPTIVTLTADALDDGIRAINAGAFDCIYKPIQRADLLSRVYRALNSRHAVEPTAFNRVVPEAADKVYASELFEPLLDALEVQFRTRTSHELRQPLEALLQFSQAMETEKSAVDVHKALDVFRTFLSAAKSLVANTAPTKLYSCLEPESKDGLKRRVDAQAEEAPHAHVKFVHKTLSNDLQSIVENVLPGEKLVG